MLGRSWDWHGATSHGAFLPPCKNKCKRYMKINVEAPTEPSLLQRAPEETASPSSSCPSTTTAPGTTLPPMVSSTAQSIQSGAQHKVLSPSFPYPPSSLWFFPRSCFQGERGQRCWDERFSCMPSPSSGPNSFFMAPCSDKSRCFSLVSVRHAISQS